MRRTSHDDMHDAPPKTHRWWGVLFYRSGEDRQCRVRHTFQALAWRFPAPFYIVRNSPPLLEPPRTSRTPSRLCLRR